eukprot:2152899-Rhodomonas_salina.1
MEVVEFGKCSVFHMFRQSGLSCFVHLWSSKRTRRTGALKANTSQMCCRTRSKAVSLTIWDDAQNLDDGGSPHEASRTMQLHGTVNGARRRLMPDKYMSIKDALQIAQDGYGRHFSPDVVDVLVD